MIELLVALLVLSVGLLGVAALMATSLRNAQSANYRSQAMNLAYDITDVIRANLRNGNQYETAGFSDPAVACAAATRPAGTYPAATALHTLDLARWQRDLCYQLPNGMGRVQVIDRAPDPVAGATTVVVVDVCWFDDRADDTAQTCAGLLAAVNDDECITSPGNASYAGSDSDGGVTNVRVCSAL